MKKNFLSILFCCLLLAANAQKVGLVLSGGGAKGIAHIGLIKVLEEHNIPIDYVAGTSIGAIVAGLYAMGMSPDEMLELFNSDDFRLWSTGTLDKDDLYYFKRKDELPDMIKLDITKKESGVKLILPLNIVPEQQMDYAFMDLTAQYTAVCNGDFNKLMVPFRCVSTDIYLNRAIVHSNGDLGEAIRASMSFPLVYKPIEKDGMLLFDGGIVNNFPTDVMQRDFAPDIIIGHKVTGLDTQPDPDDLFSQIEAMVTQLTNYEIPDTIGILLESKLDDVGLFDFPKANFTYSKGIETAMLKIDSIENIIHRRVPKSEVDRKRAEFKSKKPDLVFNNIQVEGVKDNKQRRYIIQSIKYNEKTINKDELKTSYFKLIADDHIKSIQPLAYYNRQTGFFDLHLKVEPRKPLDVDFGGHLSTRANTFGFLQANLKAFNKQSYYFSSNLFFGKFYNSFMVGGRLYAPNRNPFYISSYFTLNYWDYFSTSTDLIFTDIRPQYIRQTENNVRLEVGIPYTKTGIIDAGISRSTSLDEYYQTKVFNQGDILDETTFKATAIHVRIDKKNYDFRQYPTEGGRKFFNLQYINGTEYFVPGTTSPIQNEVDNNHQFFQITAKYDEYFRIQKSLSLGVMAESVINNKTLFSNYTSTLLSAPHFSPTPNSLSMFNEHFRANQYFALGGKALYLFNPNFHFRSEFYGFFPVQSILSGSDNTANYAQKVFTKAHFMGLAALVYQTRFGPLSAELNFYDKVGQKWFFSVNMGYMLFNKRGF